MSVTKDVQVWSDRFSLLASARTEKRTEKLFGSEIVLPNNLIEASVITLRDRSNGQPVDVHKNEWITIRGDTEEDCLKTQEYVLAVCNPESSTEVACDRHFQQLLFESTSNKLRDRLEAEYQVVLTPSRNGVCIQGSKGRVSSAVSRLCDLIATNQNNNRSTAPVIPRSTPSSVQTGYTNAPHNHAYQQQPNLDEQQLVHQLMMKNRSYLLDTIKQVLIEDLQDNSNPTSHSNSRSTSPSSYEKRISQFIELGFPRDKIETVFKSLGYNASDNDIMERLVIIHPQQERPPVPRSIPSTVVVERSPPQPAPASRDSPKPVTGRAGGLRPIVIDGSNVAMKHGNGKVFSCRGILLAVQWFQERGHKDITIFVPTWRKEPTKPEHPIIDQNILLDLERANLLKFTPSRRIGNRRIVCYDDRFIVQLASDNGGVILSNDNFRDLMEENSSWRETIENRLLMFVFVGDTLMIPSDPLGRQGPNLDDMLCFEGRSHVSKELGRSETVPMMKEPCPYKERCTFGPRCRFYHPEREQRESEKDMGSNRSPSHGEHDLVSAMQQMSMQSSPNKLGPPIPPPHSEGPSSGMPHHSAPMVAHPHTGEPYPPPPNLPIFISGRRVEELPPSMRRSSRSSMDHMERHASSPNLYPPYQQQFPPSSYTRSHTHPILMVPPTSSSQYTMDPHGRVPYTSLSPDGTSRPHPASLVPPRPHSAHAVGVHGIGVAPMHGGGYVPHSYYEHRDTISPNHYNYN